MGRLDSITALITTAGQGISYAFCRKWDFVFSPKPAIRVSPEKNALRPRPANWPSGNCCKIDEWPLFPLHCGVEFERLRRFSCCERAKRKKWNNRDGLILLKNSFLIGGAYADSIPLGIGGFCDDGTKAGSTGSAVL
ncbi:hypothetical protein [Shimia sp.]|uniref:hypothetical protein n=1 Tax=Shimia sp. TaxID=1954381 RepID=UPI003299676A